MFLANIFIFLVSFILIWYGAGLIISSISRFSKKFRLSSFAISFVFLGILTSTPEFAVGVQSLAENNPEIFVGNLLGGVPVILLFVIPILAIIGNGISLKNELDSNTLFAVLAVILTPSLLILDKRVTSEEGFMLILLYFLLLLLVEKRHGFFDRSSTELFNTRTFSLIDISKMLIGIGLVFISSNFIVDKTLYFAEVFEISAFYISLVAIAIGTNIPELALAVRAMATGKKDIAMGDYLGSAAANTFLFGLFTLLNNGEVLTVTNFLITYLFIATAVWIFFMFSLTSNKITRNNGFVLLVIYFAFIFLEFMH